MSISSSKESKIPVIYYDALDCIDFYDLNDFNNINSRCPKCLNSTDFEFCSGCQGCYCGSKEIHDICEVCKKPYHDYCDEYADKCPFCNGFICLNQDCQYRFAFVEKKNIKV